MYTNGSVSLQTCFHLGDPTFHRASQSFPMNLITAMAKIITAPVTVIINALVITAVFSYSSLGTSSNLLIGCLALSDVLVALTCQPGYVTYRLMENKHRVVPSFFRITYSTAYVCFGVSFIKAKCELYLIDLVLEQSTCGVRVGKYKTSRKRCPSLCLADLSSSF